MGPQIAQIVLFVLSILIILIGFLMAPDSNSFSGALVGSADLDLFSQIKEKGYKKFLKYTMIFLGVAMFIVSIILRIVL